MSIGTLLFLVLRPLHVLLAAIWVGSTVFITFMMMPAIEGMGPTGGQVMVRMNRGGLNAYMGALGGLTTLTGLYLFWRFTGGFDPGISSSHAGMVFGTGGVAGILATIIGGAVVGRAAKKAVGLVEQLAATPDGPAKSALMLQAASTRGSMKTGGMIVLMLQVIALILMAVGHYV